VPGSGTGATDPPTTVCPPLVHALTLPKMNSSLDAVGFIVAVLGVMVDADITSNAVPVFHPDQLSMPTDMVQRTLNLLMAVAAAAAQSPAQNQRQSN
jgi:hypothetical protein